MAWNGFGRRTWWPWRPSLTPSSRPTSGQFPAPLLDALRATVDRGARVLSVCSGAFVLGAAGLLDGRRCTTHWRHAPDLAQQYPSAIVDPGVLYVDEDPVITSAGTAAGMLEETTETVEVIADQAGFGNAVALRHHFRAWRGTTPQAYRRAFCPDASPASPEASRDASPEARRGASPDTSPHASPDASPVTLGPSPAAYTPSRSLADAYSSSGANTVGIAG